MDCENIMPREISQSEKPRSIFHLYVGHKTEAQRHRQQYGGYQRERGEGRKGVQIYGDRG